MLRTTGPCEGSLWWQKAFLCHNVIMILLLSAHQMAWRVFRRLWFADSFPEKKLQLNLNQNIDIVSKIMRLKRKAINKD